MPTLEHLRRARAMFRAREFSVWPARCPFCGPTLVLRLRNEETGVRCARCGASPVHWAMGCAIGIHVPDLSARTVCELSARGPLAAYLKRRARSVALSEFFADLPSGAERGGVRCENVQDLSYADESFDVVTHTEVMEHVPDDRAAFAQLRRVLRPGGMMFFTVPIYPGTTLERARFRDGVIEHLQPPVYHQDPLQAGAAILAFRDYGRDIAERILAAGFNAAWIEEADAANAPFGFTRAVVCARR